MAVAFASVSTQTPDTVAAASGNVVVPKPSGLSVGDLMIAHIHISTNDTPSITLLSGWTTVQNVAISNKGCSHVMYKVATSGDVAASNFTFAVDGNTNIYKGGAIYRITGFGPTSPIENSSNAAYTTDSSISVNASLTPARANDLILMFSGFTSSNNGSSTFSSQAIATDDPGWTEDYDMRYVANSLASMFGAHANRAAVTAFGNTSFSIAGNVNSNLGVVIMVIVSNTLDVTVSPSVITSTGTVYDPTVSGGATVSPSTITSTGTVHEPESGQADWSTKGKSTGGSWSNTNKS